MNTFGKYINLIGALGFFLVGLLDILQSQIAEGLSLLFMGLLAMSFTTIWNAYSNKNQK